MKFKFTGSAFHSGYAQLMPVAIAIRTGKNFVKERTWNTCREYLTNDLRGMPTRQVRQVQLLTCCATRGEKAVEEFNSHIEHGAKLINHFESHYGWPLTRVYRTSYGPVLYIVGSKKWTKSPYLFSMYTLMLRSGRCAKVRSIELSPDKTPAEVCEEIYKKLYRTGNSNESQIKKTVRYWCFVMEKYRQLFCGKPKSRVWNWSSTMVKDNFSRPEGIRKLCEGTSRHTKMLETFQKTYKAYRKERKDAVSRSQGKSS